MPMLAASQGFDLQQIIFVVVFVVVGLFQWLFKLIKEKQEQAERDRKPPPSPEEIEARRRAWQQQASGNAQPTTSNPPLPARPTSAPPPMPRPAPQPSGGGLGDLIETFRKALEEQQQAAQPVPAPPPPPLPPAPETRPASPAKAPLQAIPAPVTTGTISQPAKALTAYDIPSAGSKKSHQESHSAALAYDAKTSRVHPLTAYLRSTGGYRKAFVLKEILDAPKSMQKSPWPVD